MTYTAQDVVHHLLSSTGGGAQDGEHSAVRMSVVHGVREVTQCRQWLWHTKRGSFTSTAATNYMLPANVKDIDGLVTETLGQLHMYITPDEYNQLETLTVGKGDPYYYTIMRSETAPDRYEIRFVGDVTANIEFFYTYRYRPEDVRFMGYERPCRAGTVSSANSTTVTGTNTTFNSMMVGSLIRFGTTTTDADPIGSLSPYAAERTIVSVESPTQLTIDSAAGTLTGVRYAITDQIDASPTMYTAVLSAAEMWYARMAGKPASEIVALFNRDLRLALDNDSVGPLGVTRLHSTPRLKGWHSNILSDVG